MDSLNYIGYNVMGIKRTKIFSLKTLKKNYVYSNGLGDPFVNKRTFKTRWIRYKVLLKMKGREELLS